MKLNRTTLVIAGVAAASLSMAQSMNGFGASAGVFFPRNSTIRNAYSNTGFALAIDWAFPQTYAMGEGTTARNGIELGWSRVGGGDRLDSFHLMFVSRINISQASSVGGLAPYILAGVGGFRHDARFQGTSDHKTNFGGMIGVGADVAQQVGIEGGYRFSGSFNGSSTDGFFVRARFRF